MSRFLKNILLFTLAVVLLAIVFDMMISNGLSKTQRGHFYTMNALMRESMNADVVILGNSRAACSYNPQILDSALNVDSRNLGVSGQPFGVSYLRWRLYKRNNPNPRLLIINIDYGELNLVSNGYEREQYYPYMKDTLVKPYLDLYGFTWADIHIPLYRYRGDYKLMGIGLSESLNLYHDTKGDYIKGFSNKYSDWHGEKLAKMIKNGNIRDVCNPEAVRLLESLLKQESADSVKIVFVYAPIYELLKQNMDESCSISEYQKLANQYGIPVLNFTDMWICSDTCYFHDANHLNALGADIFTRYLASAIDSLGFLIQ